jgi:hypothetical protein
MAHQTVVFDHRGIQVTIRRCSLCQIMLAESTAKVAVDDWLAVFSLTCAACGKRFGVREASVTHLHQPLPGDLEYGIKIYKQRLEVGTTLVAVQETEVWIHAVCLKAALPFAADKLKRSLSRKAASIGWSPLAPK